MVDKVVREDTIVETDNTVGRNNNGGEVTTTRMVTVTRSKSYYEKDTLWVNLNFNGRIRWCEVLTLIFSISAASTARPTCHTLDITTTIMHYFTTEYGCQPKYQDPMPRD